MFLLDPSSVGSVNDSPLTLFALLLFAVASAGEPGMGSRGVPPKRARGV